MDIVKIIGLSATIVFGSAGLLFTIIKGVGWLAKTLGDKVSRFECHSAQESIRGEITQIKTCVSLIKVEDAKQTTALEGIKDSIDDIKDTQGRMWNKINGNNA